MIQTRKISTNMLGNKAEENKSVGQRVKYSYERTPQRKIIVKHTRNGRCKYKRKNNGIIIVLKNSKARTWHKRNKLSRFSYSKRNKKVRSLAKRMLQSSFRCRKRKAQRKRIRTMTLEGKALALMCYHLMLSIYQ